MKSSTAAGNGTRGILVAGDASQIKGNRAEANGLPDGFSDSVGLGILAMGFTTAPAGTNIARGNDDPAECDPSSLC